jgi:hypothetical protein
MVLISESLANQDQKTSCTSRINIIAYPPRPATFIDFPQIQEKFPEYNLNNSDDLLKAWARGEKFNDAYLPPSAYIPIATT